MQAKIKEWTAQIEKLSSFAQSQPHAAHSAFTHGIVGRWTYTARTNDNLSEVIEPLENVIKSKLIPALTGRSAPLNVERNMLALPPKLGGLGIITSSSLCQEFTNSQMITAPLSRLILQQDTYLKNVQKKTKSLVISCTSAKEINYESDCRTIRTCSSKSYEAIH